MLHDTLMTRGLVIAFASLSALSLAVASWSEFRSHACRAKVEVVLEDWGVIPVDPFRRVRN